MAYGVLGLTPEEFGDMTIKEFYETVQGFGWRNLLAARGRAEIVSAILNTGNAIIKSNSKRSGGAKRTRPDTLCPIKNPPRNIFFRQLFGLPW
jgi:hypothetical protein